MIQFLNMSILANGTRSSLDDKVIPWIASSKSSDQKLTTHRRFLHKSGEILSTYVPLSNIPMTIFFNLEIEIRSLFEQPEIYCLKKPFLELKSLHIRHEKCGQIFKRFNTH